MAHEVHRARRAEHLGPAKVLVAPSLGELRAPLERLLLCVALIIQEGGGRGERDVGGVAVAWLGDAVGLQLHIYDTRITERPCRCWSSALGAILLPTMHYAL